MPEVLSWYDYRNLDLNHLTSHSKTNQTGHLSALSLYNLIESQVLRMSGTGKLTNKRSPGPEAHSSGSDAVVVWTAVCVYVSALTRGLETVSCKEAMGVASAGLGGTLVHGGLHADAPLRRASVFVAAAVARQPMGRKFQLQNIPALCILSDVPASARPISQTFLQSRFFFVLVSVLQLRPHDFSIKHHSVMVSLVTW